MLFRKPILLLTCLALAAWGAQVRMPNPPPPLQRMGGMPGSRASRDAELARSAQRRHELIRADADQVLQIAAALQAELAKTPAGTVSAESLKRSEQLEKLAKRLKKELRGEM